MKPIKTSSLNKLAELKPDATSVMIGALMDFVFEAANVMDEKEITKEELAKTLGTNKSSVSKVLSGMNSITFETMAKYCAALDLEIVVKKREQRKL